MDMISRCTSYSSSASLYRSGFLSSLGPCAVPYDQDIRGNTRREGMSVRGGPGKKRSNGAGLAARIDHILSLAAPQSRSPDRLARPKKVLRDMPNISLPRNPGTARIIKGKISAYALLASPRQPCTNTDHRQTNQTQASSKLSAKMIPHPDSIKALDAALCPLGPSTTLSGGRESVVYLSALTLEPEERRRAYLRAMAERGVFADKLRSMGHTQVSVGLPDASLCPHEVFQALDYVDWTESPVDRLALGTALQQCLSGLRMPLTVSPCHFIPSRRC